MEAWSNRKLGRRFNFLKHCISPGFAHARHGREDVAEKSAIGCHVGDTDLQEIIESSSHHMTFKDLWYFPYMLSEGCKDIVGGAIEQHLDEDHQGRTQLNGIEQCRVTCNDPALTQPLNPIKAAGWRKPRLTGEFLISDATILLEDAKDSGIRRIYRR